MTFVPTLALVFFLALVEAPEVAALKVLAEKFRAPRVGLVESVVSEGVT